MPLVACSLLFTPAEPGVESDGGNNADARGTPDPAILCDGDGFRWATRQPIAFAPALAEPQENVPVGIRFAPADFTKLRLPDDPSSLRFVEAGGNPMLHEVEAWEPDVGGLVWVLVSSYPGEGDELAFDMFHGDPEAASSEDPAELWQTAHYSAVFHFNRDSFNDSMNPGVIATISQGITATEINAGDGFGHAMRFPGSVDTTVSMVDSASHQSKEPLDMSLEARFQATHGTRGARFVVQKPGAYSIMSSNSTNDQSVATVSVLEGELSSTGIVLNKESWTHAAMNVSVTASAMAYFVDGAATGSPTTIGVRDTSRESLVLGRSFLGDMDELRISREVRPPRWFMLQTELFTGNLQTFGEPVKCEP